MFNLIHRISDDRHIILLSFLPAGTLMARRNKYTRMAGTQDSIIPTHCAAVLIVRTIRCVHTCIAPLWKMPLTALVVYTFFQKKVDRSNVGCHIRTPFTQTRVMHSCVYKNWKRGYFTCVDRYRRTKQQARHPFFITWQIRH